MTLGRPNRIGYQISGLENGELAVVPLGMGTVVWVSGDIFALGSRLRAKVLEPC
jgi:hypothetical protein